MMYCHVVYVSRERRTSPGEAFNRCLFVLWELTVSSRLRSRAQDETWLGPSCWETLCLALAQQCFEPTLTPG